MRVTTFPNLSNGLGNRNLGDLYKLRGLFRRRHLKRGCVSYGI